MDVGQKSQALHQQQADFNVQTRLEGIRIPSQNCQ